MALKITLRPQERIIISGAVVTNGSARSVLIIENDVPILREKDIMSEKDATTPCKRLYFTIQLMYIDEKNLKEYHNLYWKIVYDLIEAAPSSVRIIDQISEYIISNKYYKALKLARKLINYEEEVVNNVRNSANRSI